MDKELREAGRDAGWSRGDEEGSAPVGTPADQIGRLINAIEALKVDSLEEFEAAITPKEGAVPFLREVQRYAELHRFEAFAVPADVALALLLRAKGADMNLVHDAFHFGNEGMNNAVNYALEKAKQK